ncbi:hypothetical protein N7457_008084 [Penicillium paradoxum]|uniref:uncharacterized protein n=1 Tax=Penicillium paradoxum TaxID=176176 RepID=UPI0025474A76|nr:uncharacterized protein N7457_008084 [Penicillium paradoxum]KAJ5773188.1 hypothetical protein N7457_008084 [Penicillium paradoxum]
MDSNQEDLSQSPTPFDHRPWRVIAGPDPANRTVFLAHPSSLFERESTPTWIELENKTIDCTKFDACVVSCAVVFLYCGVYAGPDGEGETYTSLAREPMDPSMDASLAPAPAPCNPELHSKPILFHTQVYLFAREYHLPDLQYYAARRMHEALNPFHNPLDIPHILETGLIDAIHCVFTTIPPPETPNEADPVYNILLKFVSTNSAQLTPWFEEFANGCPQIMIALIRQMSELMTLWRSDRSGGAVARRMLTAQTVLNLSAGQCDVVRRGIEDGLVDLSRERLWGILDQASTRLGITEAEMDAFMGQEFEDDLDDLEDDEDEEDIDSD